jgi:hypothetical protein
MNLVYTVVKGQLSCGDHVATFPFALVFENNGFYSVQTFLPDKSFYETTRLQDYRLTGTTEKGYDIEIVELFMRNFRYDNLKIDLDCYGKITLTDNRDVSDAPEDGKNSIYIVELEGLKMKFARHTEVTRYRDGKKIGGIGDIHFDYTDCSMIINFSPAAGNHYKLVFTKNPFNDNILLEFSQDEGYSRMTFANYLLIKPVLVSFLSFMNGGDVFVRKEMTGFYVTMSGEVYRNAQIVHLYSMKGEFVEHRSNFLPINENHSYSKQIIPHLFINCFDAYYQLNSQLDFISLVFSLNNSTQTAGLNEKYYILITALERLAFKYAATQQQKESTWLSGELFDEHIQPELFAVLEIYKQQMMQENAEAWEVLNKKIADLNKNSPASVGRRLADLFSYAGITINKEVKNLIKKERHRSVHEGVIGSDETESISNYWKLDHILRDIILNLINYQRRRNYVFKYFEEQ